MADLWIRSQDKYNLSLCDYIDIDEIYNKRCNIFSKNKEEDSVVVGYKIVNDKFVLGKYNNKQRALQIIDEIEKILIDNPKESCLVYEMPQE